MGEYNWKNGIFNPSCICGGSINNPNEDCERCALHEWIYKQAAEIERLGRCNDELSRSHAKQMNDMFATLRQLSRHIPHDAAARAKDAVGG